MRAALRNALAVLWMVGASFAAQAQDSVQDHVLDDFENHDGGEPPAEQERRRDDRFAPPHVVPRFCAAASTSTYCHQSSQNGGRR